MKSTIFALLLLAVLVPRPSSAGPIRDVDNSDYGIQASTDCTPSVSNSSGFLAKCFFASFLAKDGTRYDGFLVGFTELVSNVRVTFSDVNIIDAGLETCDRVINGDFACDATPTWALDISEPGHDTSLFSTNLPDTPGLLNLINASAVFDLAGTIAASDVQGERVAFLLLCSPDDAGKPADAGCDGAGITVSSLASTAPVPEPGSLLLCGSGAAMLARRLRNRRARG